jgi:endogenous inhibitor of DNA gyrase (YacG/DUF329 family)
LFFGQSTMSRENRLAPYSLEEVTIRGHSRRRNVRNTRSYDLEYVENTIDLTKEEPDTIDEPLFVSLLDEASPSTVRTPKRRTTEIIITDSPNESEKKSHTKTITKECPICLEDIKNPATTPCGHVGCHSCLVKSCRSSQKCPICRKKVVLRSLIKLYF